MDLCLLYMPYGSLRVPPLGLPLLVAAARRGKLAAAARYPTFQFARRVGVPLYLALSRLISGDGLQEWTFAGAAFPDFRPDAEGFLRDYYRREKEDCRAVFGGVEKFLEKCRELRRRAEEFVPEVAEQVLELKPKIVGCSSTYYQNCSSLALLRRVKELDPSVVTLLGGANCEDAMGAAMKKAFPWVDFVVSGEADDLIVPLCRTVLEGGAAAAGAELPYGVISASSAGGLPPAAMAQDLESLPPPDYDDYLRERESADGMPPPSLLFESSRGCWWGQKKGCAFCGMNGRRCAYRIKSPRRLLEELKGLKRRYGVGSFIAADNVLDRSYCKTFFPRLAGASPPAYSFFFAVRAAMTEEECRVMAAAGVNQVQPGLETLHDGLLRLLDKGVRAIDNVAFLKYAGENGIKVTWNMLVDIPGEKDEYYREMAPRVKLLSHLQPPQRMIPVRFERFSRYHRDAARYGLKLAPERWYPSVYPLSPEELEGFAYQFEDRSPPRRDGPGKRAFRRAVNEWMKAYALGGGEGARPELTVSEEEGRSVVRDARPGAAGPALVLEGVSRAVHRACRQPRSREEIRRETGARSAEVAAAVESLKKKRLLLEIDDRLLALALKLPLRPFAVSPVGTFRQRLLSLVAEA